MGAYGAEIVRAAIGAIPAGQYDAGAALGLRPAQIFRLVVFPQALRVMVPQLANLAIELLKATALVSLITLHDLTFEAQLINQQTLRTTEVFLSILIIYYLLSRGIVSMTTMLERRLDRPGLHPA
jgi:polar amino acid transport system permease protein